MARGVSAQFLTILDLERRRALRGLALGLTLALLALFLAELADEPRCGTECGRYLGTLTLGLAAGVGLAWWQSDRWGKSLKDAWTKWMRMSLGSTRVSEVYAKVRDRDPLPPAVLASGAGALALANVLLFQALWVEAAYAPVLALLVLTLDGLVLGARLGAHAWALRWVHGMNHALDELLQEGALGVWGER